MRNDQPLDRDGAAIPGLTWTSVSICSRSIQTMAPPSNSAPPISPNTSGSPNVAATFACAWWSATRAQSFMPAWDAQPQSIPPLLTISGRDFEVSAEADIEAMGAIHARLLPRSGSRKAPGHRFRQQQLHRFARENLCAWSATVVFQPLLKIEIEGWDLTGIADAIDLRRSEAACSPPSSSTSRAPPPPEWSTASKSPSIAKCSMRS